MCFGLTKLKERYTDDRQISFVETSLHDVAGFIRKICALPNEEFLACMSGSFGTTIVKLNKHFIIKSRLASPRELDASCICYIGNNKVVFCQSNYMYDKTQLEVMDVGRTFQILHQKVDLKDRYEPHFLVCHGDMIYGIDICLCHR
jgi:hypothetical protein